MNSQTLPFMIIGLQILGLVYVLRHRIQQHNEIRRPMPSISTNNIDVGLNKPVFNEPTRPAVLPINIEQDVVPTYKQLGFVHQENSENLPLYGRAKYHGSDQYEYYIQDGTRNQIKIPIERKKNNELYDDDTVQITSLEGDYIVSLYPREKIRYIPYIF